MPLTLTALTRMTADVTVKYGDDNITFSYRPQKFDGPMNRKLMDAANDPEFKGLDETLVELGAGWDFKKDEKDPKPLPITPNNLRLLPVSLRLSIAKAIIDDVRDPNQASNLQDGSSPEAA
jgi:hypothetical protein